MAADTAAKRYSAMNISLPIRGLNVVPNVAIPLGERQAAMFFYSGIDFGGGAPVAGVMTWWFVPIVQRTGL